MKKIFAIASIALALGLGLAACDGKQSKEDAAMAQAKADSLAEVARQDSIAAVRAAVAAPFVGTYEGELPAADASGLRTVFVVTPEGGYTYDQALVSDGEQKFHDNGTFTNDENGIIVLMSQINEETEATPFIRMQKDEEGNLIVVNADGTLPEDVKAYTLVKKSEVAETMEESTDLGQITKQREGYVRVGCVPLFLYSSVPGSISDNSFTDNR